MADKQFVSVKCEVKDVFDAKLKPGLLKAMIASVTDAINKKSGGKFSTTEKSKEGFLLMSTLTSLKVDDEDAPKKMDAKLAFSVMAIGSTAKAFNGTTGGSLNGVGSDLQSSAEDLVTSLLEGFMPKVIKTMQDL
jgi:hypothetical protein